MDFCLLFHYRVGVSGFLNFRGFSKVSTCDSNTSVRNLVPICLNIQQFPKILLKSLPMQPGPFSTAAHVEQSLHQILWFFTASLECRCIKYWLLSSGTVFLLPGCQDFHRVQLLRFSSFLLLPFSFCSTVLYQYPLFYPGKCRTIFAS